MTGPECVQTDPTNGHVAVASNIDPAAGDIDPTTMENGKTMISQTINNGLI